MCMKTGPESGCGFIRVTVRTAIRVEEPSRLTRAEAAAGMVRLRIVGSPSRLPNRCSSRTRKFALPAALDGGGRRFNSCRSEQRPAARISYEFKLATFLQSILAQLEVTAVAPRPKRHRPFEC